MAAFDADAHTARSTEYRHVHRLPSAPCFLPPLQVSRRPSQHKPCPVMIRATSPTCSLSPQEATQLISESVTALRPAFERIDARTQHHLRNVLAAMKQHRVSYQTFLSADGYGHSDDGRDTLDAVYATLFGCESALVRIQFMSGTHAIASVLFGVLRPGDELLSVAGPVYDTLEEVLGTRQTVRGVGSLSDFGISTRVLPLLADGRVDFGAIAGALNDRTKLVFIQRSFGYTWREPLSIEDIARVVAIVKAVSAEIVCFVDNCYGELMELAEPVHSSVGADVMAGSLIKNLGGGIVPAGAYVAGRHNIVQQARARLTAPGVGGGATLGLLRAMTQGLFLAPGAVGEAAKGSLLVGDVMSRLGYPVLPVHGCDGFVRGVRLGSEQRLVAFCRAVQRCGPVAAFVEPTKGVTDGYGDDVVFAQGTFVDGSTMELSADGAVREPFVAFAQGGLHWTHWAIALEEVVCAVGPGAQ